MIEEMTEQEIGRLLSVASTVEYTWSKGISMDIALRAGKRYEAGTERSFLYLFYLGRLAERIEKSLGEQLENIPDTCLEDIAAIIAAQKDQPATKIAESLAEYIFTMQKKAFRYGYYVALETEI